MPELEKKYFSVTSLLNLVKTTIGSKPELHSVYLVGEISGVKTYDSGHTYFSIKDQHSQINSVLFKGYANPEYLQVLKNGNKLLLHGRVDIYPGRGQLQFYVDFCQMLGSGDLHAKIEALKQKLAAEGIFSAAHKKKLPFMPQRIVVITSAQGAVIRDIVKVLRYRMPFFSLLLLPVPVQGKGAEVQIAAAVARASREKLGDLVIVARGGGSFEDLMPFNEEIVARAVADCKIPVISAVGHETDVTICDFAADKRAATPTEAAAIAVPDVFDLKQDVDRFQDSLSAAQQKFLHKQKNQLAELISASALSSSQMIVSLRRQKLKEIIYRLKLCGRTYIVGQTLPLQKILGALIGAWDMKKHQRQAELSQLMRDFHHVSLNSRKVFRDDFAMLVGKLETLSPLKVVGRGYAIVMNRERQVVSSVSKLKSGDDITVKLLDGKAECTVQSTDLSDGY